MLAAVTLVAALAITLAIKGREPGSARIESTAALLRVSYHQPWRPASLPQVGVKDLRLTLHRR